MTKVKLRHANRVISTTWLLAVRDEVERAYIELQKT